MVAASLARMRGLAVVAGAALFAVGVHCGGFGTGAAESPPDAAAEAAAPPEPPVDAAVAVRWCTGVVAAFCADFDGVAVDEGWMPNDVLGGRSELDRTDSVSPPASFRSTALATDAGATSASLAKSISGPPRAARVRMQVRIPPNHPKTFAAIVALRFGGGSTWFQLSLALENGAAFVIEDRRDAGPGNRHALTQALDTGKWVAVDFDVDPAGSVKVTVDDRLALNTRVTVADASAAPVTLFAGITFAATATTDWVIHYDNLRLDLR